MSAKPITDIERAQRVLQRIAAAIVPKPTCCEVHGISCRQGRDCPLRQAGGDVKRDRSAS